MNPVFAFWQKKNPVKTEKKAVISKEIKSVDLTPQAVLTSKNWLVYLKNIGQDDTIIDTDMLDFTGGLFNSKNLTNKGFSAVKYSAKKTADGAIQWEVVQVSGDSGIASWKAELKADVMRGVFCVHTKDGNLHDYDFSTVMPEKRKDNTNE